MSNETSEVGAISDDVAHEMYRMIIRQFTEIRALKSRLEYLGDNNDYDKEILQDTINLLSKVRGESWSKHDTIRLLSRKEWRILGNVWTC